MGRRNQWDQPETTGWTWAWSGSRWGIIGGLGGVIGTYVSIRNAKGPKERALTIQLAALCWAWLAVLTAWGFLTPRPWNQAANLLNLPLLMSIPRMNRWLAQAQAEDEAEA